jgi:two-component system, cell cycle sensor histidine kinase and response regulator CckA
VLPSADPHEALALLRSPPTIDLALIDLVMPRMSGIELWERVRVERPSLKVLLMSGYAAETVLNGRLPDGVPFPKPFTLSQLAVRVRQALDATAR